MDRLNDQTGYEINFVKEFYKYQPLKKSESIKESLFNLDKEISKNLEELNK